MIEVHAIEDLRSPAEIQAFLEETVYSDEPIYRCPVRVLRDRRAHCVDGALLAAAALRRLGHRPLILDLRAVRDDDHVIAVFKQDGHYGAIAKSNVVPLRFREPVYRTPRELAMSYFDGYYNLDGERSLRSYSAPFDLRRFDALDWEHTDEVIEAPILTALDAARHFELLSPAMIARLHLIDRRSYDAGLLGSNPAGLFKPT
ncbi:MAG: hypothetical protein EXR76_18165 [Myxococcales bacterium]|nr:hypothetical protein [Myxococcales bacterium]